MRRLLILVVRCYRRWLSPWLPDSCRFEPTCSCYAIRSLEVHGVFKGCLLTTWRLLRCQPFARFGRDPVPPRGCWRHPERALTRDRSG